VFKPCPHNFVELVANDTRTKQTDIMLKTLPLRIALLFAAFIIADTDAKQILGDAAAADPERIEKLAMRRGNLRGGGNQTPGAPLTADGSSQSRGLKGMGKGMGMVKGTGTGAGIAIGAGTGTAKGTAKGIAKGIAKGMAKGKGMANKGGNAKDNGGNGGNGMRKVRKFDARLLPLV
jgi:hypothetical protein